MLWHKLAQSSIHPPTKERPETLASGAVVSTTNKLPSVKLTASLHQKMDGWKMLVSFWEGFLAGGILVSGRVVGRVAIIKTICHVSLSVFIFLCLGVFNISRLTLGFPVSPKPLPFGVEGMDVSRGMLPANARLWQSAAGARLPQKDGFMMQKKWVKYGAMISWHDEGSHEISGLVIWINYR